MIFSKKNRPLDEGWYHIVNNIGRQIPKIIHVEYPPYRKDLCVWDRNEGWLTLEEMEKRDYYWGDEVKIPKLVEMID